MAGKTYLTMDEARVAIMGGELDDHLDELKNLAEQRLARKNRSLRRGDRVVCKGLRPHYINELPATVVKVNLTTATIKFDPHEGGRFNGPVRCPLTALHKLDS